MKTSEGENYDLDEPNHDYGEILGFEGEGTSQIQEEIVYVVRPTLKGCNVGGW